MSKYSTGELAKACDVTVRTVQYYDKRGILVPCEMSEGGRRVYSEEDVKKLQLICFLRDLGLSIDTIADILAEPNSDNVLLTLLNEQARELESVIEEETEKLKKTRRLIKEIQSWKQFSLQYVNDIAITMKGQRELTKMTKKMLTVVILCELPFWVAELITFVMIFTKGVWVPFVAAFLLENAASALLAVYYVPRYYRQVAYICPECHTTFKPVMKEFIFASHTPRTRKLTCTQCGHKGYSVEVYDNKYQNMEEKK